MIDVPITDVPSRLPELIERSSGERVFITRDGQRVAALVSIPELGLLEDARDEDERRDIEAMRHEHEEIGIPLSEVRAARGKPHTAG